MTENDRSVMAVKKVRLRNSDVRFITELAHDKTYDKMCTQQRLRSDSDPSKDSDPLCQSLFKLSGLHGALESAHYKVVEPGVSKNQTGRNT